MASEDEYSASFEEEERERSVGSNRTAQSQPKPAETAPDVSAVDKTSNTDDVSETDASVTRTSSSSMINGQTHAASISFPPAFRDAALMAPPSALSITTEALASSAALLERMAAQASLGLTRPRLVQRAGAHTFTRTYEMDAARWSSMAAATAGMRPTDRPHTFQHMDVNARGRLAAFARELQDPSHEHTHTHTHPHARRYDDGALSAVRRQHAESSARYAETLVAERPGRSAPADDALLDVLVRAAATHTHTRTRTRAGAVATARDGGVADAAAIVSARLMADPEQTLTAAPRARFAEQDTSWGGAFDVALTGVVREIAQVCARIGIPTEAELRKLDTETAFVGKTGIPAYREGTQAAAKRLTGQALERSATSRAVCGALATALTDMLSDVHVVTLLREAVAAALMEEPAPDTRSASVANTS